MKKSVLSIIIILLGNALLALSVGMFILPYNILSGGVAGIAVALHPLIHIDREIAVDIMVVGLFIVGWIFLGKEFAAKTVMSTIAYPVMLNLVNRFMEVQPVDTLVAALYGGLLAGAGVGLVMSEGASTGGMDIPPLIVHRLTKIKLATLVLITDALTVLLGFMAYDLQTVLVGLISVFASSFMVDKVLMMNGISSKQVQIISEHYQEIVDKIHTE
ncbi:MAG: YitT family protein, partial [Erysipelotrichaceae bacterium]|nr:YitT family protein [Erysipelotrichaceae bacterium]